MEAKQIEDATPQTLGEVDHIIKPTLVDRPSQLVQKAHTGTTPSRNETINATSIRSPTVQEKPALITLAPQSKTSPNVNPLGAVARTALKEQTRKRQGNTARSQISEDYHSKRGQYNLYKKQRPIHGVTSAHYRGYSLDQNYGIAAGTPWNQQSGNNLDQTTMSGSFRDSKSREDIKKLSIQAIITQKVKSATSRQNLDSDERNTHIPTQPSGGQGSPKMLIDYAKKKRGLAYTIHRESLGEKRIKSSQSSTGQTLTLSSQAISLQQRYPLLNSDLEQNKKVIPKPPKTTAQLPPQKSTPIKDIIEEGEEVTASRRGGGNSQGSLINSKNHTPAASNQLIPTGIFSSSLPPSRVQITHSRKVIHQTLHLPNLDKNGNKAQINRTASGSAANRTFSGPMYHPGESMVKYLRQFDSPNQLSQRGALNSSDSPPPRFAGSYYINQLNAQRLNKAFPVAKATTLHRRFNSTLNSYLSAPIADKDDNKKINVQEDPKQQEIPSESYSPQRDDVDIVDSRLQSKANLTERKKKRPQSSFDLCTLRAKFNKNFVQSESMTKKIKTGIITKPMLAPIPFKFGQKFKNKSEEERYLRNCTEFLKLRTLLINDPSNARDTLMSVRVNNCQFLMRFLEREIIEKFTDLHVQRLVKTVLEFKSFDPCVSMTEIIKAVMNQKYDLVGLKFTEFNTKEEEILRVLGIGSNTARQYSQMQEKLKRVEMPPTTHECLKQQGVSFPRLMEWGDHTRLDRMINKVIEKQKKIRVGEHPKPYKMTSPRELRPPIAVEVEEFSQEIKGILKEKKELDVMKRNKLLLEHVIRERVKQKTIESGMQLEE